MAVGICRKRQEPEGREVAVVRYPDGEEFEMTEARYRLNGYSPTFEDLPACDPEQAEPEGDPRRAGLRTPKAKLEHLAEDCEGAGSANMVMSAL